MNISFNDAASSTWTAVVPQGVTFTAPNLSVNPAAPMGILVDYTPSDFYLGQAHGIVTIDFLAPPAPPSQQFGLRTPLQLSFQNDLGVPVTGFNFYLTDDSLLPSGSAYDTTAAHPSNYAHFHGVAPDTFPGQSLTLYDPAFGPGAFGGVGMTPAPAFISASGTVGAGATAAGKPITLHQVEQPGTSNSFSLSFYISGTDGTVPMPPAMNVPEPAAASLLSTMLAVMVVGVVCRRGFNVR